MKFKEEIRLDRTYVIAKTWVWILRKGKKTWDKMEIVVQDIVPYKLRDDNIRTVDRIKVMSLFRLHLSQLLVLHISKVIETRKLFIYHDYRTKPMILPVEGLLLKR